MKKPLGLAAIILCLYALPAQADDPPLRTQEDDKGIFTLAVENDYFVNQDEGYTSGLRLGYLSSETSMPDWIRYLGSYAPGTDATDHNRIGVSIGQSIFTPKNTQASVPDPNDRPYAGWLYGSVGVIAETGREINTYQLTLGIVGPDAEGEEVQNGFHELIGDHTSKGWNYQLRDEPGAVLTYDHKWKGYYESNPLGYSFDATPHVGFNLGNVYTNAITGVMFRLGENLPDDYGPPEMQPNLAGADFFIPTRELGWYFFAGADGEAVGRNIFLDGNSFQDSPSVQKKYFVGHGVLGIAATYGEARIAYNYDLQTNEFRHEPQMNNYGAITVSYRF